jgi:hypothetical protein
MIWGTCLGTRSAPVRGSELHGDRLVALKGLGVAISNKLVFYIQ